MINILKTPELLDVMKAMKSSFKLMSSAADELRSYYPILDEVDDWIYSTGPVFDEPPYEAEISGYDSGRILKKKYSDPYEARLKGAYSSGFKNGRHVVTVSPSKPVEMPVMATFFTYKEQGIDGCSIKYFCNKSFSSSRPPSLVGLRKIFFFEKNVKACVIVGAGPAYSIELFYHDESGLVTNVSLVSAPFDFQTDCELHYDVNNQLCLVASNGVVWQRKEPHAGKV